ncbi:hypothetical protein BTVI_73715 [Pitangus sulphuratus]|nr:hypothetical protein BTVI_73715 [Pitangus sulphuratus]
MDESTYTPSPGAHYNPNPPQFSTPMRRQKQAAYRQELVINLHGTNYHRQLSRVALMDCGDNKATLA